MVRYLAMVIAVFGALSQAHAGGDPYSGNSIEPGCKAFTENSRDNAFGQGVCAGILMTLISDGPNRTIRFCPPSSVTVGQAVRIMVKYFEDNPENLNMDFASMAVIRFRQLWPCTAN